MLLLLGRADGLGEIGKAFGLEAFGGAAFGAGAQVAVGGVSFRFGRVEGLVRQSGERGFGMQSCGRP